MLYRVHFITPVGEFYSPWVTEIEANRLTHRDGNTGAKSFVDDEGNTIHIPAAVMANTVTIIASEED